MTLAEPRRGRVASRLDPDVFRLPVERIREGYYTDAYFNLTKELLEANQRHPRVVMQVFQKHHSLLGGIDEAIAVLKLCSGRSVGEQWQLGAVSTAEWTGVALRSLLEPSGPTPAVVEILFRFGVDNVSAHRVRFFFRRSSRRRCFSSQ